LRLPPSDWGADALIGWSASNVALDGSDIDIFYSQIVTGPDGPARVGFEAQYVAAHPALNNQPSAHFANSAYLLSPLVYASPDFTYFYVIDNQQAYGAAIQYIWESQTGTFIGVLEFASGRLAIYDAGARQFAASTTPLGAASHAIICDGTGNVMNGYSSGGLIGGSPVAITGNNINADFALGSRYGGGISPVLNAYISEFWILKRLATAEDLANWFAWTLSTYGI